jgi:hypothetical protein
MAALRRTKSFGACAIKRAPFHRENERRAEGLSSPRMLPSENSGRRNAV